MFIAGQLLCLPIVGFGTLLTAMLEKTVFSTKSTVFDAQFGENLTRHAVFLHSNFLPTLHKDIRVTRASDPRVDPIGPQNTRGHTFPATRKFSTTLHQKPRVTSAAPWRSVLERSIVRPLQFFHLLNCREQHENMISHAIGVPAWPATIYLPCLTSDHAQSGKPAFFQVSDISLVVVVDAVVVLVDVVLVVVLNVKIRFFYWHHVCPRGRGVAAWPAWEWPRVQPIRVERKTHRSKEALFLCKPYASSPCRRSCYRCCCRGRFRCRFRESTNKIIAVFAHSVNKKQAIFPQRSERHSRHTCKAPAMIGNAPQ